MDHRNWLYFQSKLQDFCKQYNKNRLLSNLKHYSPLKVVEVIEDDSGGLADTDHPVVTHNHDLLVLDVSGESLALIPHVASASILTVVRNLTKISHAGLMNHLQPWIFQTAWNNSNGCNLTKVKKSWKMGSGPGSTFGPEDKAPWISWMFNFGAFTDSRRRQETSEHTDRNVEL